MHECSQRLPLRRAIPFSGAVLSVMRRPHVESVAAGAAIRADVSFWPRAAQGWPRPHEIHDGHTAQEASEEGRGPHDGGRRRASEPMRTNESKADRRVFDIFKTKGGSRLFIDRQVCGELDADGPRIRLPACALSLLLTR